MQGTLITDVINEKLLNKPQEAGTCAHTSLATYYRSIFSADHEGERLLLDLQAIALENYFTSNKDRITSDSIAANLAEKSLTSYITNIREAFHRQVIDHDALRKAEQLVTKLSPAIPSYPLPFISEETSLTTESFVPQEPILLTQEETAIDDRKWIIFDDIEKDMHHLTAFAERLIQANNAGQYLSVLYEIQELALALPLNPAFDEMTQEQLTQMIRAIGIISREHSKARGLSYKYRPGLEPQSYIAQVKLLAIVEKMASHVLPSVKNILGPVKPSSLHSVWSSTKSAFENPLLTHDGKQNCTF